MSELQELKARREEVFSELREIESVSEESKERILEAIKNQRWYFFVNNKYILMDKRTGFMWPNLDYFNCKNGSIADIQQISGYSEWRIPTANAIVSIVNVENVFPFCDSDSHRIEGHPFWRINGTSVNSNDNKASISLDSFDVFDKKDANDYLLPYSRSLLAYLNDYSEYARDVFPGNKLYTDTERAQFTLDLFTKNNLWPKFDDDEITELYGKIYMRKPELTAELQELDTQIASLQTVQVLSSKFDYTALLAKYDINAINSSLIKYFKAIQNWTESLMSMIEDFERAKEETIRQFSIITLTLSKKYEDSPALTPEENSLLRERIAFFRNRLALGMHSVKSRIISVKSQADELEARIDSTDSITELAVIEHEQRAVFPLIAENTARIITDALRKIEFFESHGEFVSNAVKILTDWTENYRVFRTTYRNELENTCKPDGIDPENWEAWFTDWQCLRLEIEKKLQPMLEWGLKGDVPVNEANDKSVPEEVISVLAEYRAAVDKFYLEERKGIHQEFAFAPGGSLSEKFKAESMLYKCTLQLQSSLQKIIFNCTSPADRIFILKWADSLLDIQVDGILAFIADNDMQKISAEILEGFAALKQKNYDVYLSDAQAYGEEQARREKEYNSLIYKMRKDLAKGEAK